MTGGGGEKSGRLRDAGGGAEGAGDGERGGERCKL